MVFLLSPLWLGQENWWPEMTSLGVCAVLCCSRLVGHKVPLQSRSGSSESFRVVNLGWILWILAPVSLEHAYTFLYNENTLQEYSMLTEDCTLVHSWGISLLNIEAISCQSSFSFWIKSCRHRDCLACWWNWITDFTVDNLIDGMDKNQVKLTLKLQKMVFL